VTSTVIHPITCSIILLRLAQASVSLPLSSSKSINNYRHIVYTYMLYIKSWDCCVQIEQSDLKTNPFQCWINTSELSNFNVKRLIKKPLSVLDTMPVLTSDHIKDLIEKVVWLSNPLRNTSRYVTCFFCGNDRWTYRTMMKSESDTSLNQPSIVVSSYRKFSTVSDDIGCT